MVKVPPELTELAVLTEPLSIVEKGIEQIRIIQSRLPWACPHPEHSFLSNDWGGCKTALVVGAGPLGLLATALLRLSKASTCAADIVSEDHPKAGIVKEIQAKYIDVRDKSPEEIVSFCCSPTGNLDMIFEASGAAEIAVKLVPHMSRSSIYVMTGIPRGDLNIQIDAAQLVRQVVRYNQVVVGSVNSNRRHFEMALKDIGDIALRYEGLLDKLITHHFRIEDYQQAFAISDPNHIKTVIKVSA